MATRGKKATAPKYDLELLKAIVAATVANSFVYTSVTENGPLIAEGLVEINEGLKDESGAKVATRATAKGVEVVGPAQAETQTPTADAFNAGQSANKENEGNSNMTIETPQAAPAVKTKFAVVTSVPIPTAKRGAGAGLYPFDTLPVNGSFFVPATAEKPTPAKSLASTVSSATKRYAESDKRVFIVRSVSDGAAWGDEYKGVAGAGVWRQS